MKKMEEQKRSIVLLIIFCLLFLVSWTLSCYFARYGDERLILLGVNMFSFPFVVSLFYLLTPYIKNLIICNRGKKKNVNIVSRVLEIGPIILFLFIVLRPWFLTGCDLINGPKEITLYNVIITKKVRSGRGSHTDYYLEGVTSKNKYKKIKVDFYRQSRNDIYDLLEKNYKFKIFYFENSNIAYRVEEY